jgi:hypothetical protein
LCKKCGHKHSQIRKDFSRTCNLCSHTESAGAGTSFHKVKFGLKKAFFICFEMATTTKSLSGSYTAKRFSVQENTDRLFMHKVRAAMKSSEDYPMTGTVHFDGFVVGGYEEGKPGRSYDSSKKKAVCAVELTEKGKVKRFYSSKIPDYSAKSLKEIFEKHIDKNAEVTTCSCKGYKPLCKEYNITQILSSKGANFKALHTTIHQVKSWLRATYSWVGEKHIKRYLDEYCYRINRSQIKHSVFDNLIKRIIKSAHISAHIDK